MKANKKNEYRKRDKCAICGNKYLHTIIKYGNVPLAGDFPSKKELNSEHTYDLSILFCDKCSLLQTNSVINADTLFLDYRYMSSIGLQNHFNEVANFVKKRFNLNKDSKVIEIGSNDGVLLKPLKDLGIIATGFEPAINISKIAKKRGCKTINDYFNYENVIKKYKLGKSSDLVISTNSFAHIDDIHSIVKGVKAVLKDYGYFMIEVHYVKKLIESLQYDNIYHEHIYYYSLTSLNNLFSIYDMTIVDYEEIPIHSGSIRVVIKNANEKPNKKVQERLSLEHKLKIDKVTYYKKFAKNVKAHIKKTRTEISKLKNKGYKIVGYGASGRANMLCNLCDLTPQVIDYIADESPERIGRYITGKHIPIVSKEYLLRDKKRPDYIVIFAWNFSKMIINKLEGQGYKYIIAFPKFKIINNKNQLNKFVSI